MTPEEQKSPANEPAWKAFVENTTVVAATDDEMCLVMGGLLAGVMVWKTSQLQAAVKRALIQRKDYLALLSQRDALQAQVEQLERIIMLERRGG